MQPKSATDSTVILTQLMGPADANSQGNVHGGFIMKLCDEAGGMASARYSRRRTVTVAVDSMRFLHPVHVGNLVTVTAEITWVGRTSIETRVSVVTEEVHTGLVTHTNTAYFVYVALDDEGKPTQVPPLLIETEADRERLARAEARRALRLTLKAED